MIRSVSVAGLFRVLEEDSSHFVIVDFSDQTVHSFSGLVPLTKEKCDEFFGAFRNHQSSMTPAIPYEEIYDVISSEKTISKENERRIFERK
jgi:hypothetical protein